MEFEGESSRSKNKFMHLNDSMDNSNDNGTYFYKIVVAPSTQRYKLRIPEDYVKEYGESQLKKGYIKLRVPDDRVWKVELIKEDGQLWLAKGWEVLYKAYGLKQGYFLLFRFDKVVSEFNIFIFDITCFEIEYDEVFYNQKFVQDISYDKLDDIDGLTHAPPNRSEVKSVGEPNKHIAFESWNPHFVLIMQDYNVSNRYRIYLPIKHVREHLKKESKQVLLLIGANEKSYNVILRVYDETSQAEVQAGWRNFVKGNQLNVGDTCVFELIRIRPSVATYKITIFKVANC
ncbi:unnamed protein product [Amaranthus hypochondriacus]